jgi:hypothetical protein
VIRKVMDVFEVFALIALFTGAAMLTAMVILGMPAHTQGPAEGSQYTYSQDRLAYDKYEKETESTNDPAKKNALVDAHAPYAAALLAHAAKNGLISSPSFGAECYWGSWDES